MDEKIKELYLGGLDSPTRISEIVFPEINPKIGRKRVWRTIQRLGIQKTSSEKVKSVVSIKKEVPVVEDRFILSAWNQDTGKMMDIDQYCDKYKLPRTDIKDYKLVTHTGTPYYNIHFKDKIVGIDDILNTDFIDSIVSKYIKSSSKKSRFSPKLSGNVTRAVYTDVHVGMNPNPNNKSIYGGKWDKESLMDRMRQFCDFTIDKAIISESEHLVLDDLGDLMDGWESQTVRRDHLLPQNMTTQDAFDAAVAFKIGMVDIFVNQGIFDSITLNNVCNDNHSGAFGYVVNSAVKSILESKYDNVLVNNYQKFINHYFIGDHCFIICHGKDDKNMKFGFKTNPDAQIISKIDQYIKSNNLYKQAKYFEFSKGDSHQMVFDFASSDDFRYMNYPAFSPSSDWVQTNFKKGKSGFVVQVVNSKSENIEISYKYFNWDK